MPLFSVQNVYLTGLQCVCSISYRQTNHSTIMLSTPSLLLIIDQVITACVAPHTDIRCQEREREGWWVVDGGAVGGGGLGICQHPDELIYCWVLDC